ncbi:MAG TPA: long-chain-fatty-acid--CoA ligase [bacterium]|nr:long-chain-fatty-acid--CoA ligase [bacterium]
MSYESNYTPLTPQSFLRRSARVFPDKTAVISGTRRYSYREFYERACRQANALSALGATQDVSVAVLAPNTPEHLEACYGVHMAGAVLVALNYRLSPPEIAYILSHCKARVLIVDHEYLPTVQAVIDELKGIQHFIVVRPDDGSVPAWEPPGARVYEEWLAAASTADPRRFPDDENDTISINYTSGTTGSPKGVMYTHRSAYLNAVCNLLEMGMGASSVYLWTLPMFHCNGWCYTWGVTAAGGTHVCMRAVSPADIVAEVQEHQVTHFCGAPIVLRMVVEGAQAAGLERFDHAVKVSTAAAPPSPTVIEQMLGLNVDVIHVYGLTETYGPTTVCEIQPVWKDLPTAELVRLMARQGVPYILSEDLQVLDEQDRPVSADGQTLGEVCMRGNIVAKGYYDNPEATAKSFRDGWFHSGDLGVMHPDGYIELRDRAKDIIISGGENISTIEVENVLYSHPAVADVAVVSRPDEKWGEVPVAFVTMKPGSEPTEAELIEFCRTKLAHFKAPKAVYFQALPRTSTGKVQKYVLREQMWEGQDKRIGG